MRLWPKNPRVIEDKDLGRLEKQIVELGLYKPLEVTPDGEVLGGNQRFKVLQKLYKSSQSEERENNLWVWVSVVEAWNDADRLKYALSDNDAVGKYKREKILELIKPLAGQESLFDDYKMEIGDKKTLSDFHAEIDYTEKELKLKQLKNDLLELGLKDETITQFLLMAEYNRESLKLDEVDIQGCISGVRQVLTFWFDDDKQYQKVKDIFATSKKVDFNTDLLLEILKKQGYEI